MAQTAFGKAAAAAPKSEPSKVVRYELVEGEHEFMKVTGQDDKGRPIKVPTGEVKGVAKLRGVHADGTPDKLAAWIWLDDASSIDALIDSMAQIYTDALRIRAIGEEHMGWAPRPSKAKVAPKAEAPAAPAPKTAFGKAKAVEAEAKAISNGQEPGYADLPF